MTEILVSSPSETPTQCLEPCADPVRVAAGQTHQLPTPPISNWPRSFARCAMPPVPRSSSASCSSRSAPAHLVALTGITASAVSQHLRILRRSRLVKSRRQGKQVYHTLDDAHVALLVQIGVSHVRDGDTQYPAMQHLLTLVPLNVVMGGQG